MLCEFWDTFINLVNLNYFQKEVRSLHNSDSSTDDEGHYTASYSNPVDGALSNINFQNKARVIFPEYGGDVVEKNGKNLFIYKITSIK